MDNSSLAVDRDVKWGQGMLYYPSGKIFFYNFLQFTDSLGREDDVQWRAETWQDTERFVVQLIDKVEPVTYNLGKVYISSQPIEFNSELDDKSRFENVEHLEKYIIW